NDVVTVSHGPFILPTQPEIQRKPASRFPVILNKHRLITPALDVARVQGERPGSGVAQFEGSVAKAGGVASRGGIRSLSKGAREAIAWRRRVVRIEGDESEFIAGFESVGAGNLGYRDSVGPGLSRTPVRRASTHAARVRNRYGGRQASLAAHVLR